MLDKACAAYFFRRIIDYKTQNVQKKKLLMEKFVKTVVKLRWLVVLSVLALTVYLGYNIKGIKINSDLISALPDNDPAAKLSKEVGDKFGGNATCYIAYETDNVFKPEVMEEIKAITDSIKDLDGISSVTSLTNVIEIKGSEWGLDIGNLVDEYELPKTKAQLDSLKQRIFSKDMYRGSLVSEDSKATLIMVTIMDDADNQSVAKALKAKVGSVKVGAKLFYGGLPFVMNDVSDLIVSDIKHLLPITFIIILFVLYLSFKSWRGVVLPVLSASIAIIWTMGLMNLLGYQITLVSNTIPILLLAVGTAYSIHVVNRVNECTETEPKQIIIKALSYIIIPVILASLTTVIGFLSFVFGAYLTIIRDFGIFTALGVFFALVLAVFFVPALLAMFPKSLIKKENKQKQTKESKINTLIINPLTRSVLTHTNKTLLVWGLILVISIVGVYRIERKVNMLDYFKKDNPTRIAEDILKKQFGGSEPVHVVFKGDIQNPIILKKMLETEAYMKKSPYIEHTQSVADLIKEMNDVMGEGSKIPAERAKIEQLWFLLDGQDIMPQLVSDDLQEGIIQSRFSSADSKDMKVFVDYMNKYLAANQGKDFSIEVTGMPAVYVSMDKSLIESQFSSLVIAVLLVLVIVGIILKSFKQGLFATIPVLATIVILFGFMGLVGIPLDIATVLVASVALGIGIDYSIHIITHYNHELKASKNPYTALENTLKVSGKAIVINVLSVAAGFIVLTFSQIVPLQNFGLLVSLSMIGSGMGALTLLPVVLLMSGKRKFALKEQKVKLKN